jgi:hypothetical protein
MDLGRMRLPRRHFPRRARRRRGQDRGGFYSYTWLENLFGARIRRCLVFDPIHFIMERKMMLGIRDRAEAREERREAKAA